MFFNLKQLQETSIKGKRKQDEIKNKQIKYALWLVNRMTKQAARRGHEQLTVSLRELETRSRKNISCEEFAQIATMLEKAGFKVEIIDNNWRQREMIINWGDAITKLDF